MDERLGWGFPFKDEFTEEIFWRTEWISSLNTVVVGRHRKGRSIKKELYKGTDKKEESIKTKKVWTVLSTVCRLETSYKQFTY